MNRYSDKMSKKQRISMHDVYKHLEALHGIKSVSSPSAQITTPCALGSPDAMQGFDVVQFLTSAKELSVTEKAVIELMAIGGLRISEVLNVCHSDVSKSGSIRIRALKGSAFRVVQPFMFKEFWLNGGGGLLPLSSVFSRYYFYRLFRKYGLYATFGDNQHRSVTHYFRHLKGLDIQESFNDWQLTSSVLGHKSINSTQYYGKKRQK